MASILDRAFIAHASIKARLKASILHPEGVAPETLRTDRTCEFGLWIYGEGQTTHGQRTDFRELIEVHKAFHEAAYQALLLSAAGQHAEATHAIESGEFERRSQEMKGCLLRLKSQAEEPPDPKAR